MLNASPNLSRPALWNLEPGLLLGLHLSETLILKYSFSRASSDETAIWEEEPDTCFYGALADHVDGTKSASPAGVRGLQRGQPPGTQNGGGHPTPHAMEVLAPLWPSWTLTSSKPCNHESSNVDY